ncbi:hypothetical protein AMJ39_08505 [candidate division TA06 bacterium DG_24]|uniref:Uncharacterized protein n=2 Tax=Bacteria division TA06 TaxID=1156500 RepID=A0A0S8J7Q8_UNCT6|nr:MAG: hypothetical protein AMJ39_08505 [candidate division TA06 bacterium DG_24]KPL05798.1 MAG: hypothetical protein AMJ71_10945 [candidate division TA06 bacterium SM1_40]
MEVSLPGREDPNERDILLRCHRHITHSPERSRDEKEISCQVGGRDRHLPARSPAGGSTAARWRVCTMATRGRAATRGGIRGKKIIPSPTQPD